MPFVDLMKICPDIIFDIRYATDNNFLKAKVYSMPLCFVHPDVALAIAKVQNDLKKRNLGLKVYDGYRPLSVQKMMWDAIQDERYISNPAKTKGRHTRGTAVDVTLVDSAGEELEMPTSFDEFSEKAHSDFPAISEKALHNRSLLAKCMQKHSFHQLPTEWWHFDYEGWNDDIKYPSFDISFESLS